MRVILSVHNNSWKMANGAYECMYRAAGSVKKCDNGIWSLVFGDWTRYGSWRNVGVECGSSKPGVVSDPCGFSGGFLVRLGVKGEAFIAPGGCRGVAGDESCIPSLPCNLLASSAILSVVSVLSLVSSNGAGPYAVMLGPSAFCNTRAVTVPSTFRPLPIWSSPVLAS